MVSEYGLHIYKDKAKNLILPKKIVLKDPDFKALKPNIKNKVRQYNNEVKIYSHYFRKVYKPDGPLVPVSLPIDRLDINPDVKKNLKNLKNLKNRGLLLNDGPDAPFIRQAYANKIMAAETELLDRPEFPSLPPDVQKKYFKEHDERRSKRDPVYLGTVEPYPIKNPEYMAAKKTFKANQTRKQKALAKEKEEDLNNKVPISNSDIEEENFDEDSDLGRVDYVQQINVKPKSGGAKRKTARKSVAPKRKTARKSVAKVPKRSVRKSTRRTRK